MIWMFVSLQNSQVETLIPYLMMLGGKILVDDYVMKD